MRYKWLATTGLLVWGTLIWLVAPSWAQAPSTGRMEFEARVTPGGGQAEPVRQLSFYLLRKDLADIRSEASQNEPLPDLDHFVDSLDVSPELKAWVKKNHTADFTGREFTKKIKADDIMNVPEFLEAYNNLMGSILKATLPESQAKESDRLKNPKKYQAAKEKYQKALSDYIAAHPESIDGLDAELTENTINRRWIQVQGEQKRRVDDRAILLAQEQYLAAKVDSDLDGRGAVAGLVPGTYWITTLDTPALAGDVRLQWDVPVVIRAGQTTHVVLSNLNALPRAEHPAH